MTEPALFPQLVRIARTGAVPAALLALGFVLGFASSRSVRPERSESPEPISVAAASAEGQTAPGPAPRVGGSVQAEDGSGLVITSGTIDRGSTLAAALMAQGVSPLTVHYIGRDMVSVFDFRDARPGDRYRLVQEPDGTIVDFRFSVSDFASYHLYRDSERYRPLHVGD